MLVHAFLRRLVVVGHHRQAGLRARLLGRLGQLDRLRGGIGAGARNDRHAPGGVLDRDADQLPVLVESDRGRFAGGADDADAVRALGDMPIDQAAKRIDIERPIADMGVTIATRLPLAMLFMSAILFPPPLFQACAAYFQE